VKQSFAGDFLRRWVFKTKTHQKEFMERKPIRFFGYYMIEHLPSDPVQWTVWDLRTILSTGPCPNGFDCATESEAEALIAQLQLMKVTPK
jgi:hypothetical protein